ncbi:MexH family multidrug efflux RND transporter periplasmic adaptor subunit [Bacteroidia bacterium]|nr:MexH family multidrug efflux RND transporter periplasmic adaptor subunit [Bacteroidia bacterium]
MKKSIKVGIVGCIVLVLCVLFAWNQGWWWFTKSNKEIETPVVAPREGTVLPVEGIVTKYSVSLGGIRVNGTLLANEEVELVAEIVGKVTGIFFTEGSSATKGQLLLKVDDADLQAQLTRAEFQHKLLSEKLERQRILLQRESVSREDFDQLQTDCNVLEADIKLLNVKISRTEIRAPFDGIMGFRYVSEGSYVQPNTRIATIVDNSTLKFNFAIPERHAYNDLFDKEVLFTTDGGKRPYTARVYAIDPMLDVNTRSVLLRARFNNQKNELKPGMFAKGELRTDDRIKFIAVPSEAVVPEMEGKRMWVLKDGKAHSVKVETESRDVLNVEVVAGIQVGDTVLTSGLMQLRDGMKVNVTLKESTVKK